MVPLRFFHFHIMFTIICLQDQVGVFFLCSSFRFVSCRAVGADVVITISHFPFPISVLFVIDCSTFRDILVLSIRSVFSVSRVAMIFAKTKHECSSPTPD